MGAQKVPSRTSWQASATQVENCFSEVDDTPNSDQSLTTQSQELTDFHRDPDQGFRLTSHLALRWAPTWPWSEL